MSDPVPTARQIAYLVACTTVVLLLLFLLGPIYDTNDDPAMVSLLSGYFGGTPHPAPFLSHPASVTFMHLYALAPGIPWYGAGFELITILTALAWAALLGLLLPNKRQWIPALILLFTAYAYLILRLNFMALTLSLFFVSVAWLWYFQVSGAAFRWRQLMPAIGVALAYAIRPTAWPIMAFMAAPIIAVSIRGDRLKRLAVSALVAGALIAAIFIANRSHSSQPDQKTYWELSSARSYLVDAPHEPTPEALEAADWSAADYHLAMLQWMHDEEIFSPDRMWKFIERARRTDSRQKRLAAARGYLATPFHVLFLIIVALCVIAISAGRKEESEYASKPFVIMASGLWYIAGTVLLISKRFPPRVFVPLYLFLAAWLLLVMPAKKTKRAWLFWPTTVLASLLLLFTLYFWASNADNRVFTTRESRQTLRAGIEKLPPDARVIPFRGLYDSSATPVLSAQPSLPGDRILPGGWVIQSPAYSQLLESWGYASGRELMKAAVEHDDLVWVIRAGNRNYLPMLLLHLQIHYAPDEELDITAVADMPDSFLYFFRVRSK